MATEYDFSFGVEQQKNQGKSSSTFQGIVIVAVMVLVTVTAFLLGIMFERRTSPANSSELATFWETWEIIEDDFYGDLPEEEARKFGAIQGLVASLGDPFTSFAPPDEAQARREDIDGFFGGIGVEIEVNPDYNAVQVTRVIPQNPAADVGILAGDVFFEVDGQSVIGFDPQRLARVVRGEVGTDVLLTMYRPEEDEQYEVSVRRAIIEQPIVFSENLDGIGYVQLSTFSSVATSQLEGHIEELLEEDIDALILDLRRNGGGLLNQAVSIADLFLDDGTVLIQRSADTREVFESSDGDILDGLPMMVLVDSGTASAAEVVAGALQDRDRALLVGQQTFGKGVIQNLYDLNDGSQLRVTSAAWYTPDDNAIHNRGLAPDLPVDPLIISDPTGEINDPARQAAVDYLREIYLAEE